jgi:hypothetical protein
MFAYQRTKVHSGTSNAMMKQGRILTMAVMLLALSACKPDKPIPPTPIPPAPTTGVLRITLVPEWEGDPLERFFEYRNFMEYRTTVEVLKLYLGDVRLVDGVDTLAIKDVDLFDLGNGAVSKYWPVKAGSWSGLRMALGVPDELNYADPANYGSGHPLSVSNGTYWTWATGYRYVVFEGRYDTDPSSTGTLVTSYAIHPGMEPSYLEFDLLPVPGVTIVAGDTTEVRVRVAVDRFFHSEEFQIDLETENTAHGNNLPLQWKFVNNVVRSMRVE